MGWMLDKAQARVVVAMLAMALAVGACNVHQHGEQDMGDVDMGPTPGPLVLTTTLTAPQVPGLSISEGQLELRRVSLFGDVAADDRTMIGQTTLGLPEDSFAQVFSQAPYGLYSRVQVSIDDVHLKGTWRSVPLEGEVEVGYTTIDLRGPTLDYEPTMGAHFVMTIDTSKWFDPAALDAAAQTDGVIRLDYFNNPSLVAQLISALQGSFALDAASEDQTP